MKFGMRPALALGSPLNRVRVDVMTKPTDVDNPTERAVEARAVESEIREVVRGDVAAVRRSPETDSAPRDRHLIRLLLLAGNHALGRQLLGKHL